MVALLAASALYMSGLQAGIAAPTDAFRGCLRDAATKAKSEKVTGDSIEAYLKRSCTAQMGTLTDALVAFRMKNGMTRRAASADAAMTVDDYVSTPADNYKFLATETKQAPAPATPAPSSPAQAPSKAATPTPATSQPPKL